VGSLIKTNGGVTEIRAGNDITGFTLDEVQRLVGGRTRLLLLNCRSVMVVNSLACQTGTAKNQRATEMLLCALLQIQHSVRNDDVVHGDALIATYEELQLRELLEWDCL
jgi:hypothetical protein